MSFGTPLAGPDYWKVTEDPKTKRPTRDSTKFYTGNPDDTPWNRDLLWKTFVVQEGNCHLKRPNTASGSIGLRRTMMGVTGTLVPEAMMHMLNTTPEKIELRKKKNELEASKFKPSMSTMPFRYSTPRDSARGSRPPTGRSGSASSRKSSARTSNREVSRSEVQMLKTMLKDERRKREKTEEKLGNIESKLDTLMEQIGNGRLNTRRSGYSTSRSSRR
jgi:hypothetical protein